jgi:hypothetical protein
MSSLALFVPGDPATVGFTFTVTLVPGVGLADDFASLGSQVVGCQAARSADEDGNRQS